MGYITLTRSTDQSSIPTWICLLGSNANNRDSSSPVRVLQIGIQETLTISGDIGNTAQRHVGIRVERPVEFCGDKSEAFLQPLASTVRLLSRSYSEPLQK